MKILKHIPNSITSLNLFAGCVGLYFVMLGRLEYASMMIFLAAVFDFFDGFAARLLHVKSDIGKELDSLADVVSFGVLPGFIVFSIINSSQAECLLNCNGIRLLPFVAFLIPVFSALRLAIFNLDTRQTTSFIGLPTPANAILVASFPLIALQQSSLVPFNHEALAHFIYNPWLLAAFSLLFSYLLVSPLPLFSLKFQSYAFKNNQYRYIFLLSSLILIICLGYSGMPLVIAFYLLFSVIEQVYIKRSKN
ncbi:MAG: CDP-diacylglycerol--serine O-phosphatidyltransferase [Bacteroidota bacterium]